MLGCVEVLQKAHFFFYPQCVFFLFSLSDQGGNSNPCADNYSGPQGFSEPETRNLRSLLLRLRGRIALYLSMHSYGQFFLYPWGYDAAASLDDEADMVR